MKSTNRTAAGAAVLLAAGIVGLASADAASAAPAKEARITSVSQLKASIAHAAALEAKASTATLGTNPAGRASSVALSTNPIGRASEAALRAPACSADQV